MFAGHVSRTQKEVADHRGVRCRPTGRQNSAFSTLIIPSPAKNPALNYKGFFSDSPESDPCTDLARRACDGPSSRTDRKSSVRTAAYP
jgi:hypothetical protein